MNIVDGDPGCGVSDGIYGRIWVISLYMAVYGSCASRLHVDVQWQDPRDVIYQK